MLVSQSAGSDRKVCWSVKLKCQPSGVGRQECWSLYIWGRYVGWSIGQGRYVGQSIAGIGRQVCRLVNQPWQIRIRIRIVYW